MLWPLAIRYWFVLQWKTKKRGSEGGTLLIIANWAFTIAYWVNYVSWPNMCPEMQLLQHATYDGTGVSCHDMTLPARRALVRLGLPTVG